MIATTALAKEYGARTLFADVSLQLNAGRRYGLVGANGSGKTTFLQILAGDEAASEGTVTLAKRARIGVLRQDRFLDDAAIILDLAMRGDAVVWNALTEQRRIADSGDHLDAGRLADLEDQIAAHDGYTLEARASRGPRGARHPHRASTARRCRTLSGGFKLRVLLAQVLVGGADVLLLDEPTNHLDILSIRWLEKFLADYAGCAVVISHDQRFLDNVTTHTLDVDYGTITLYTGNYSTALVEKAAARARKETAIARAEEEIAHKRAFVERFGAKATKATQAQSRLKQIEKIEVEELADELAARAACSASPPSARAAARCSSSAGVTKSYGDNQVLRERVADGPARRAGRRSSAPTASASRRCCKIAVERLDADAGRVRWGHEVRVGYFPQDHHEVLTDGEATPLSILGEACPGESPTFVRGQLGRVLFSGDEAGKKVRLLSGGEARASSSRCSRSRSRTCSCSTSRPTTSTSRRSTPLVEALKAYTGTLIFVSHDRWFVSELATRIIELTPAGPNDFPGTYAEYLARLRRRSPRRRRRRAEGEARARRDGDRGRRRRQRRRRVVGRLLGGAEAPPQPHGAAAQAARQGDGGDRGRRGAQEGDPRPLRRSGLLRADQPRRDRRARRGAGGARTEDRRADGGVGGARARDRPGRFEVRVRSPR